MLNASSRTTLIAALALSTMALSGCGGNEEPAATSTEQAQPEPTAAAVPTAPAAMPATTEVALIDLASADAAAGKAVYEAKCAVCHSVVAGEGSVIGPHLDGAVDRKIASAPDFAYSPALSAHDGIWDVQTLSAFLAAPQKFAPGTRMGFAGIPDEAERANLIAYLETVK